MNTCYRRATVLLLLTTAIAETLTPLAARDKTPRPATAGSRFVQLPQDRSEFTWPSLIHLLAHPDKYHGREVTVGGYLEIKHEGTAVYLSREHAEHGLTAEGFWVSFDDMRFDVTRWELARQFHGKYVLLQGTFDRTQRGFRGLWSGGFHNVTRLSALRGPNRELPVNIDRDTRPSTKDAHSHSSRERPRAVNDDPFAPTYELPHSNSQPSSKGR